MTEMTCPLPPLLVCLGRWGQETDKCLNHFQCLLDMPRQWVTSFLPDPDRTEQMVKSPVRSDVSISISQWQQAVVRKGFICDIEMHWLSSWGFVLLTLRIVPPLGGCVIQTFRFSWKLSPESHLKPPGKGAPAKPCVSLQLVWGNWGNSAVLSVSLARWLLVLLEP